MKFLQSASARSLRGTQPAPAPWAWALAGAFAGLLLAVVFTAPARWLSDLVQQGLDQRVRFEDPRGTLWNGSARLVLTGGAGSTDAAALPGRLTWRIRPTWSGLGAELQAPCCMQQAWHWNLLPHWGGARLVMSDGQSQWPAQWLTGLGTPWNTVQAEGLLQLTTQGLTLEWAAGRFLLGGQAQIDALELSSRLSTLKPMGSYRLVLKGGATPELTLQTIEGSLQLSGKGQWVGARLRFNGVASARADRLDALSNLLNIIGRREGASAIIKVG